METSIATIIIQFSTEILLPSNHENPILTKEKQVYNQTVNHNIQQKQASISFLIHPIKLKKAYALNE